MTFKSITDLIMIKGNKGDFFTSVEKSTLELHFDKTCQITFIARRLGIRMYSRRKRNSVLEYIVTCRRGGVSNKPPRAPGSDKTRGQGFFGPFTGGLNLTPTGEIKLT